ncbi:hypothetical protein SE18_10875 [Herpetosiphon geysericola]|uniref:SMODS-associated and fused to various effectors domain-containing protein n=2 Tax=Herpetosiphon geysericola TaxID=70996 RepID=A0A0P6YDF2_9CHLR|nr:hypothetical protein SE18_10875 [Herpetosiphon geysericola]
MVIIGQIAHIEASSDIGPRANPTKSAKDRDEYDNLILLCQNCHARLDGQKNTNTVEYIRQLRDDHEVWVRNSLPERGKSTTGWFVILLQGIHPFDLEPTISALIPDFPAGNPKIIKVNPDKENWTSLHDTLREEVELSFALSDPFESRIAVFPLAPISACITLGYHLTNRPRVRLFQYHRDNQSWRWPDIPTPEDSLSIINLPAEVDNNSGELAICFNLSSYITEDCISELGQSFINRINVTLDDPSTGWLQHPDQLIELASKARHTFEKCVSKYPKSYKWHIFYAGPAPGAVAVGQQINPTMCPPVQLYEYVHGRKPRYQPSILLFKE